MNVLNNFAVLISIFVAFLYVLGLFNFILRHEGTEQCQMTYMFQFPQFIRIRLKENLEFPQYGLYAYSEGKFAVKAKDMKFSGVPVLFIPGNGGSYKQVRSLSSIALRKAVNSRESFHFDFFSVDLNEDLSGLFGGVLELQSQFVNHSIYRILSLYSNISKRSYYAPPKTVILIGHSMGGMVALKVLTNPEDSENVDLIITLSTPHYRPAVAFDYQVVKFYEDVDKSWNPRRSHLLNKTLVTIGSGYTDILVNTHLTQSSYSDIHVVTTGIPRIWVDVPHVVIVWCKQVVLTIIKSLFDSIEAKSLQLHESSDTRLEVFQHHFVSNSGIKRRYMSKFRVLKVPDNNKMVENTKRQDTISMFTTETVWIMIPFDPNDPHYQNIVIEIYNFDEVSWIYGCEARLARNGKHYCETVTHLTQKSRIVPSKVGKKREFRTNVQEFKELYSEFTHFVVRLSSGMKNVRLNFDKYMESARTKNISIPHLTLRWTKDVFFNTVPKALFYKINLNNFDNLYQGISLTVTPECEKVNPNYQVVASLKTPWMFNDISGYFTHNSKKPIPLSLFSPKPVNISENITTYLELSLDPSCRYKIKLESNFMTTLENLVRHYSIMLLGNFGAILLLVLRFQLYTDKSKCHSIHSVFANAVSPLDYLKTSYIVFTLFSSNFINSVLLVPDYVILQAENMDFIILPLILYITAVGITFSLATALWFSVVVGRFVTQKLAIGYMCRRLFGSMMISEWMFNIIMYFTTAVGFGALLIWYWSSGAVALIIILFFYYFKLVKMYEDYLENLMFAALKFFARVIRGKRQINKPTNNTITVPAASDVTEHEIVIPSTSSEKIDSVIEKVDKLESEDLSDEPNEKSRRISDGTSVSTDDDFEQIDISAVAESYEDYVAETKPEINEESSITDVKSFNDDIKNNRVEEIENVNEVESEPIREAVEEILFKNDERSKMTNAFNFHFTVFLICLVITGISIPSALTWARNYGFDKISLQDPSSIPMLLTCVSVMIFWEMEDVRLNLRGGHAVGSILYFLAILCTIYSTIRIYRLPYILSASLFLVAVHQKFAQEEDEEEEVIPNDEDIEQQIEQDVNVITQLDETQQVAVKPESD